ncbi:threonine/serine exporter [Algoriphagus lacus]|uniref:Threonine/serine exporter n=1 Tax=Algoriphagus lacus TaxID=2056311 RepID=A0A418PU69_9BACT|nr:threonine/serine exporter family protein [Algoriphagus lacus]RIW17111.1 threonine/serine exporter [Algoriphagus lacus]
MEKNPSHHDPQQLGRLLLDMGITILHSGAPTRRVNLILYRVAKAYGYELHLALSTRHLSISLQGGQQENAFSGGRSKPSLPGVNFRVVSEISTLSLELAENQLPLDQVKERIKLIKSQPHYPRIIVLTVVSLAGSAFCYTFGGDYLEMGITFLATFFGLFLKQELTKRSVNTYLITFFSAVLAALVIGLFWKIGLPTQLDQAFATSVLFLVPGVPLVISFVDLLDGFILNGIERGVNALMHAFGIAAGLAFVLYIFQIPF